MVGDATGDRLAALRLAVGRVPLAGQLPGALDGLAAAGGEEDPGEVERRGLLGEPGRQVGRGGVGDDPGRRVDELGHLGRAGRADLGAVGVPEVGAVEPGEPVDDAAPVVVDHVAAVAADVDGDVLVVVGAPVREVQQHVVADGALDLGAALRGERDAPGDGGRTARRGAGRR